MKVLEEEGIKFLADDKKIVDSGMEVFYNPIMKLNRDLTIQVLKYYFGGSKKLRIGLPLAASGVRAFRILKEIPGLVGEIHVNDFKENFKANIMEGLRLNGLDEGKIVVWNTEGNLFLRKSNFYDYVDVDPYGSPMPFLQSAVSKTKHDGIIAVTATDTSCLCGTYSRVCSRRYWSRPLRNYLMHEVGLRILIKACQQVSAQQDKALIPLLSYSKDHYFRVFFVLKQSKKLADETLRQHKYFFYNNSLDFGIEDFESENSYGKLYVGSLGDSGLVEKFDLDVKLVEQLKKEYEVDTVGFIDPHEVAKDFKLEIPRKLDLLAFLNDSGMACESHFSKRGVKTSVSLEKVKCFFK